MFDATCDRCASIVLLGPRRVVSLENTDEGILLTYRCYCGETGTALLGRAARSELGPGSTPWSARVVEGADRHRVR